MRKLYNSVLLFIVLALLVSCNGKSIEKSILGNWYLIKTVIIDWENDRENVDIWAQYPEFGEYYNANFWSFNDTTIIRYYNKPAIGSFVDFIDEYIILDGVINYTGNDGVDNPEYIIEIDKDKLVLTETEYDIEGNAVEVYEIHFGRYDGDMVPENWLNGPVDDIYEPDDQTFTELEANEIQQHSITENDVDNFKFNAIEGHEYFIKVRSKIDLQLTLSSGQNDILVDDDNDQGLDIIDPLAECVILWTATATDQFNLEVMSPAGRINYYEISLVDITLEQTTLAKIEENYMGKYKYSGKNTNSFNMNK